MQSGLYVALSSQISLEKRMNTIADNLANMNTVGFRATQMKFDDVMTKVEGAKVDYVSTGEEYLSSDNGAMVQTKNPLDFAIRGDAWFSVNSSQGPALTKDGRFSMLDTGEVVTLEGNAVLDSSGAPIQLNPQAGPPTASKDGILYQNNAPVAQLGLFEADVGPNFTRVGNTAIIPTSTPQPVVGRSDIGVMQGFIEEANVNPILQMTQMITVSRTFEYVSQLMRSSENSMGDAIKTLGGAK
jgi:flagellar basal-body rod protein FlgF